MRSMKNDAYRFLVNVESQNRSVISSGTIVFRLAVQSTVRKRTVNMSYIFWRPETRGEEKSIMIGTTYLKANRTETAWATEGEVARSSDWPH